MIIDPKSVSFETIKEDIITWLQTRPDSAKWKDYFSHSTGNTIVELLAGLSTFFQYNILSSRKETYLQYTDNRSSAIAIAQTLGYSVHRGRKSHQKLTIDLTSLQNDVSFSKYDIIGKYGAEDIILLDDNLKLLTTDTAPTYDANVVVGAKKQIVQEIAKNQTFFRFDTQNISEDYWVKLSVYGSDDLIDLSVSPTISDLVNYLEVDHKRMDQLVMLTNAFNSIDIMCLNENSTYKEKDQLIIDYIEMGSEPTEYKLEEVKLDFASVTEVLESKQRKEPESTADIKINAPLFHETKYLIRSREDYTKLFQSLISEIAEIEDVNSNPDDAAAEVALCYVPEIEGQNLNSTEIEEITAKLAKHRPFGVNYPSIDVGQPVDCTLTLKIKAKEDFILKESIKQDIITITKNAVAKYEKKLQKVLDIYDIESIIEDHEYVKYARIEITSMEDKDGAIADPAAHIPEWKEYYLFTLLTSQDGDDNIVIN